MSVLLIYRSSSYDPIPYVLSSKGCVLASRRHA